MILLLLPIQGAKAGMGKTEMLIYFPDMDGNADTMETSYSIELSIRM